MFDKDRIHVQDEYLTLKKETKHLYALFLQNVKQNTKSWSDC